MASLDQYERVSRQADKLQRELDRAEGAESQLLAELKELGCSSIEEAEELLQELTESIEESQEEFEEALSEFEREWDE